MSILEQARAKLIAIEGKPDEDGVILVNGADIQPMPVAWLWKNWLALGKMHILAGAPGQGKTTIATAMAATVTAGGRFPDGACCTPGNVLIWSGEDDPADTLLPRLMAAGANKDRVYFVTGSRVNGEVTTFDPARDMVQLVAAAERVGGVDLLIVDPVVSAVAGDSHKNTEVRRALQPLIDLAAHLHCAVLGISHFSKGGQGQDPTQRVVGSVAFAAVARVVWVAAKVKSDDGQDRRILARSKSNIGLDNGGFEYHLEQVEVLQGIEASRVAWGQSVEGSAQDLLTDPARDDQSPRDDAVEFLRDMLDDGPVPVKTLQEEAKQAGHTWATVRRASDGLLIVKKKGGMVGGWYWQLPKVPTKVTNMLSAEARASSAPSATPESTFGDAEEVL